MKEYVEWIDGHGCERTTPVRGYYVDTFNGLEYVVTLGNISMHGTRGRIVIEVQAETEIAYIGSPVA